MILVVFSDDVQVEFAGGDRVEVKGDEAQVFGDRASGGRLLGGVQFSRMRFWKVVPDPPPSQPEP